MRCRERRPTYADGAEARDERTRIDTFFGQAIEAVETAGRRGQPGYPKRLPNMFAGLGSTRLEAVIQHPSVEEGEGRGMGSDRMGSDRMGVGWVGMGWDGNLPAARGARTAGGVEVRFLNGIGDSGVGRGGGRGEGKGREGVPMVRGGWRGEI